MSLEEAVESIEGGPTVDHLECDSSWSSEERALSGGSADLPYVKN